MAETPASLFPEHLADLRKSGLAHPMIETMRVRSLTPEGFEQATAKKFSGVDSYLAFPYPGIEGYVRYKLFPPILDEEGKLLKYFQPKDSGCHLYILPQVRKALSDPSIPIFLVEGEKKSAVLVQTGKLTVGLGGIWNWLVGKTHEPIPDLDEIVWKNRVVYLVPDSDAWRNDQVLLAVHRLGKELERRGAIVQVVRLPDLPGLEKTGADDYLAAKGTKMFERLVTKTVSLKHHTFHAFRLQEKKKAKQEAEQESEKEQERQKAEVAAQSQALLSTPTDLYQIHAKLEELSSASHDLIELILATAVSLPLTQGIGDALIWLLVVGNPSSDKTNQVTLVKEMPHVYFLDTITENSFITGYLPDSGGAPKDLLAELDGRCLIIKELGALFSLKAETIRKVLGDLQAIYDGHFSKFTGTRGKVDYKAAFPFIACITPLALKLHQHYMELVGPRFLSYRLPMLTEEQIQGGFELSWQQDKSTRKQKIEELRRLVSAYAWQLYNSKPTLLPETPEQQVRLNKLAMFLSYGRAVVLTERRKAQGEGGESYTVYETTGYQREEPFRALQQLRGLARSLAVVHRRERITDHELELVRRIVLSSMPPERAGTLRLFQEGSPYLRPDGGLTRKEAEKGIHLKRSYNQVKRYLQELETLGLIESEKGEMSKEWVYYPVEQFQDPITTLWEPLDHLLDLEGPAKNFPYPHGESVKSEPQIAKPGVPLGEVYGNREAEDV